MRVGRCMPVILALERLNKAGDYPQIHNRTKQKPLHPSICVYIQFVITFAHSSFHSKQNCKDDWLSEYELKLGLVWKQQVDSDVIVVEIMK